MYRYRLFENNSYVSIYIYNRKAQFMITGGALFCSLAILMSIFNIEVVAICAYFVSIILSGNSLLYCKTSTIKINLKEPLVDLKVQRLWFTKNYQFVTKEFRSHERLFLHRLQIENAANKLVTGLALSVPQGTLKGEYSLVDFDYWNTIYGLSSIAIELDNILISATSVELRNRQEASEE